MSRRTAAWALAAVLGLVLAAGVSWATSRLASERIGLASEPITAGSRLAPKIRTVAPRTSTTTTPRSEEGTARPPLTETSPSPPAATVPESQSAPPAPAETTPAGGGDDSHPATTGETSGHHDD